MLQIGIFGIATAALILLGYFECYHIYYMLFSICFRKNVESLPTPLQIRHKITQIVSNIPKPITLIDFGCGSGDFIKHIYPHVTNVIGIELDYHAAQLAQQRFSHIPSISIHAMNMVDYQFPLSSFVLYMYEPLWCLPKKEAIDAYDSVMNNIKSQCFIIYVSGVNPILDISFFNAHMCSVLHHSRARRGLGWNANHIYLLHKHVV